MCRMDSSKPWIPFYVRDYRNDLRVQTLTFEDKGLYTDMLFLMWDNGGVLPADLLTLAKIFKVSEKKFAKKFQKISFFFQEEEIKGEVFLTQKRLKAEYEKSKVISDKRRQAVSSRVDRQVPEEVTNVPTNEVTNIEQTEPFVSDLYPYSHSHNNNNKEIEALGSSPTADFEAPEDQPLSEGEVTDAEPPSEPTEQKPKTQRQRRDEFDFKVNFDEFACLWNRHMPKYGLTQISSITRDRERAFKDRVLEDPAERNDITWWGDVLRFATESDLLMGKGPPKDDRPPWRMDVDWLIGCGKEMIDGQWRSRDGTMLARLLEGKHHDSEQAGRWRRGEYKRSVQSTLPVTGTG